MRREGESNALSVEEGRALFDRQARKLFGISGDEWLRRYDADELDFDGDDHDKHMRLSMLIPFAHREQAS